MENRCHLLLVLALVAAVNSQSYPRFEFRGDVLVNNSYILRPYIGEGYKVAELGRVYTLHSHLQQLILSHAGSTAATSGSTESASVHSSSS